MSIHFLAVLPCLVKSGYGVEANITNSGHTACLEDSDPLGAREIPTPL
jgi:hypothetical protein